MVYNWDRFQDIITHLYVTEQKPVDEIVKYMRIKHGFTPSKRQFQTQFRAWDFPTRHRPELHNEPLVARVKELWERNLSHEDMLRVLNEEDGFRIKSKGLFRVRRHHRWLLRAPPTGSRKRRSRSKSNGQSPSTEVQQERQMNHDEERQEKHSGEASVGSSGREFSLRPAAGEEVGTVDDGSDDDDDHGGDNNDSNADPIAAQLMEERRLKMEAESHERWASKKRRRRTRSYAGMPADPPGPPRFRSETTIAESLTILALDKNLYAAVRDKFQYICETTGITKKTLAGPQVWEAAKNQLVDEFEHLQRGMWIGDDLERNKLALDIICCDVTKRMRSAGDRGQKLTDVKSMLGLNPNELREVKAAFSRLLEDDGATSKVLLGIERWEELKQRWVEGNETLRTALARSHDATQTTQGNDAVETLARDVMKRLRDNRRERKTPRSKRKAAAAADDGLEEGLFVDDNAGVTWRQDRSSFHSILVPDQSHRSRMPSSSHLVDAQMHAAGMQMPIANTHQLDPQLPMHHPTAQTSFLDSHHQQFMPAPAPMAPIPQMVPMAPMPSAPAPYDPTQPAAVFDLSGAPTANTSMARAIYLRELDAMGGPVGDTWIAWLPTGTLEELRLIAAQKLPGSTCTQVLGLVKMLPAESDVYLPLSIHDDQQLSAHFAQEPSPTFHVRLVTPW